jgi:uncharacterized membrane protein
MVKFVVPMAEMDTLAGMSLPTRPRLTWIDLLRGLAVVGMIETHVMNTVLDASFDDTRWRHELGFFNGLLAPAFLWIAGFVQGLGVRRAQAQERPVVTVARLRRLGLVALLGYLLHVPWNFWGVGDYGPESWRIALQVDILPCMAVTLTMLLCAGLARGPWFDVITCLLAAFFVFLAPAAQPWHTGWIFVDSFVTCNGTKSLFPLFPWVAFCAMGSFASRWEMSWKTLLPVSLALIALGMGFAPSSYAYVHPAFFAERLGWLGLLIIAVWLFSQKFAPAWLQLVGRESLFIYVAHLLVLFSVPWRGTTLNLWIGRTLSIPQTVIAFFIVLGICLALAWANERRRERKRIKQPLPL